MSEVVPFGKYKGQPLAAMAADQQYLDWLLGQAWFRDRYQNIYTLIVNNFAAPSETPEHNALQARFLDPVFCLALAEHLGQVEPVLERCRQHLAQAIEDAADELGDAEAMLAQSRRNYVNSDYYRRSVEEDERRVAARVAKIAQAKAASEAPLEVTCKATGFEVRGWDVVLELRERLAHVGVNMWLELKPSLGDEYPAILRQMKANSRDISAGMFVLVIGEFTASGARLEQVRAIFAASNFRLVLIDEIDG